MPTYTGTSGDDSYWGGPDADFIEGLGGNDYLLGNGGDDEILGGDGNDNLHGGDGDDILDGGDGDDWLQGNDGIDTILGGAGNDRILLIPSSSITGELIDGGDGVDTLQLDGLYLSGPITFSAANPAIAQNLGGATIVNVEQLSFRGSGGNDDITGGSWNDYIDGFDGDDRIDGGGGDDNLDGGFGTDTIYGGDGNDTIRGGSGGGNDVLYGDGGDDTFHWNSTDALIDGGTGIDQIRVEYYTAGIDLTVNLSNPNVATTVIGTQVIGVERLWIAGGDGNDRFTGGAWDDVLIGNKGNDILTGGDGNDSLSGGDGSDQLYGGAGDDFLHSYPIFDLHPSDVIDGGAGFDTLEFWARNYTGSITIDLNSTTGTIRNVEQIHFTGGSGQNHVSGGAGNDTLWGGVSNDYFDGRGGDDDIRAGDGNDVLIGGAGNDFLDGGNGGDSLSGGDGNDLLQGWGGNDNLNGGLGDDELFGADGTDSMTGGAGNDLFYGSVADMNGDTITDFSAGDRIILLDATLAGFTFSVSGNTLTFTGGSLTLGGAIKGTIVATLSSGGGVQLEFNDARNDFNGDGRSDILWRDNTGALTTSLGQANGGFASNAANFWATVPTSWSVIGTGDFNGDHRDDILWRNPSTGEITNWLGQTNGGFVGNDVNFYSTIATSWQVVGIGDFNGDGRDDLLWRNSSTGETTDWLGQANGGFAGNDANALSTIGTSWQVAATGDFNGDGNSDILWRDNTGAMTTALGQFNGGFASNAANFWTTISTSWQIVGSGDFNGDGRDDILWRNPTTGEITNWLGQANGSFSGNDTNFYTTVATSWQVEAIGDFNGDGRDDLLWRNGSTGQTTDWLGQANGSFAGNDANALSVIATSWQVQPDNLL